MTGEAQICPLVAPSSLARVPTVPERVPPVPAHLCSAESVPIVMSVPQKSLSIEPTMPTMLRWAYFCWSSALI